ncbi:MBL fold metallo-hydrolase [Sediminibacillus dalangtanensis]|uniref:MBL fold metallo-hydrolase n=1 Tax=Sediminibacillus dalangtanensis TaxID=2729421 RepID=A0ABX7VQK3_9BACI|nr:MBL fold metallo-hydrolase [Sediminibacillus dalangtanensis]QTM98050.1 MBL fold metallo-hydrolase [Sediminibacillus dalangtanensis]
MDPLTVKELANRVLHHEDIFILDIRRREDYQDWKIEGRNVESINIPLAEIKTAPAETKQQLPQDRPVYIVCYRGISAQTATGLLKREGMHNVTYLIGGITGWGEHLEPVKAGTLASGGSIYQFIRLGKGCLSYMIVIDNEAMVIDPSRFTEVYQAFADKHGWTIKHVADTHLHADHLSGGKNLAEAAGAMYWFPPEDDEGASFAYTPLEDGMPIALGDNQQAVTILASPGHTLGSTSFLVDEEYLLTGDTLFVQSIGRPDLAGKADEWAKYLHNTLYDRFPSLSQDLVVLPTHFSSSEELTNNGKVLSTLQALYTNNQRLNVSPQERFIELVTENLPPQPNSYQEIRQANLGLVQPEPQQQQVMEAGPNRCAVS